MLAGDHHLSTTVAAILSYKIADRLSALPLYAHAGIEEYCPTGQSEAVIQFKVLIYYHRFIPSA